jgi:hypothetical protein
MEIQFTTQIFKEGRTFVAHTPELDVSSCGGMTLKNLKEAVGLLEKPKTGYAGADGGSQLGAPSR